MMLLYVNLEESNVEPQHIQYSEQYKCVMEELKEMIAAAVCGTFDADRADKDIPKGRECIVRVEAAGAFVLVVSNIKDDRKVLRRTLEAMDNNEFVSRYFHPKFGADFYDTRVLVKVYYAPGMVRLFDPERDLETPSESDRKQVSQYAIMHNCTESEANDELFESRNRLKYSNSFNAETIMNILKSNIRSTWD